MFVNGFDQRPTLIIDTQWTLLRSLRIAWNPRPSLPKILDCCLPALETLVLEEKAEGMLHTAQVNKEVLSTIYSRLASLTVLNL